jgi:two-component sensor histidine kinase
LTQTRSNTERKPNAYLQSRSVRSLLLFVVAAALAPVFFLSFVQAYARLAQDRETVRRNLVDRVSASASQASQVVDAAEQALAQVGLNPDVLSASPQCSQILSIAQLGMPHVTNLSRVNARGRIQCSARPIQVAPELSDRPWWRSLPRRSGLAYAGPVVERSSGRPVFIVALGLSDANGAPDGHIVLGIDLVKLEGALRHQRENASGSLTLLDRNNTHVSQMSPASRRVPGAGTGTGQAPQVRPDAPPGPAQKLGLKIVGVPQGTVLPVHDHDKNAWSYAFAPIVDNNLYVAYAVPDRLLYTVTFQHVATDIALPLIALLLASAGAWFAIELWAIVPAEALRKVARRYAVGQFDAELPMLLHGPSEMVELRDEMAGMARRAVQRDSRLKKVADQKDQLVKELHHRVKNNLQMVMSLLSLQARSVENLAHRAPLDQAQARIAALALIQRLVIDTDDGPTVDAFILMDGLCTQIRRSHPEQSLRILIKNECDHVMIENDIAIPLALFAFEAVTNALRHGFSATASGHIRLRFTRDEENIGDLQIIDSGIGWDDSATQMFGTGHRLLTAFARQLGGKLSIRLHPQSGSCVGVSFRMAD